MELPKHVKSVSQPFIMDFEREFHRKRFMIADLFRTENTIIYSFLQEWQHGAFSSFEQCLVAMVAALAEQNKKLMEDEIRRLQMMPFNPHG